MPFRSVVLFLSLFCLTRVAPAADDPTDLLFREIAAVAKQGTAASPAARAAWDRLVARGPAVLPRLLDAMDTPDPVVANWLRTAFDRIVEAEQKQGGKRIDTAALLAFARDPKRQGRTRRLALGVVDQLRPGTRAKLISGWLEDPEFGHDAVVALTDEADATAKAGDKGRALALYRKAFAATRDVPQAQVLARRLQEAGQSVSLAEHFGFLTDWYAIGPFDARAMKGFRTVYPPEQQVDLTAELDGKAGKVRWKRYRVKEAVSGLPARVALVNLVEPLGNAEDAVGFAYTAVRVLAERQVEFRGSADDNFAVWVNGRRVFGFEEYRNGVRLDRHRFPVTLRPGVNTILVKVCQAPADATNAEPNWEFLLRIVDQAGKGLTLPGALPKEGD